MSRQNVSRTLAPQRKPAVTQCGLLQRKCDCGNHTMGGGECAACSKEKRLHLQTKLKISEPGDAYEQEADRIADQVMTTPAHPAVGGAVPRIQCFAEQLTGQMDAVPSSVEQALASPGRPLDPVLRQDMEQRFAYDFSRVQVHSGAFAEQSAQEVNANAYTVGEHLVFDTGRYSPSSHAGRRLLAHELAHVVQQRSGVSPGVQRQPKPDKRIDVAIVFGDEDTAMTEARSYAPTVLRVTNGEDARQKLLALGKPLGRIYVVSHSNRAGEVEVVSAIGTISWVKLSDLSKDLKGIPGATAPTDIDFRGCKLGEAPQEMETFRKNIGAQRARGMTCWSFVATVTPLVLPDGTALTDPSQVPKDKQREINEALIKQIGGLRSDDGHPVKDCIEGLAKGETANRNLAKIRRIYFEHKGNLSATWASPAYNRNWQKGSMCVKDLTADTSPCKFTTVSAPAATPASKQKGKK